ncbi:hypothetical protein C8F04DRAFT_1394006 [Mycena alexandri]|uniref:DUF6532 domain-containing protein n=1 Tax=Mycena alexandri TaxID=1745969 RepID=A0AAD6X5X9_9AGAR|nr:hypothetical protein C8F04DRAFT_1394006 [Mycena alexandri]
MTATPRKNKSNKKAGSSAGTKAKTQTTARPKPASQAPKTKYTNAQSKNHDNIIWSSPPRNSILQPLNGGTLPLKRSVLTNFNQKEGGRQRKSTVDRWTRESNAIYENPKPENPKRKAANAQLDQEAENEAAPPTKKTRGKSRAQQQAPVPIVDSPLRPRPKPTKKAYQPEPKDATPRPLLPPALEQRMRPIQKVYDEPEPRDENPLSSPPPTSRYGRRPLPQYNESEGNFLFQNISPPSLIIADDEFPISPEEHRKDIEDFVAQYPPVVILESDAESERDEEEQNDGDLFNPSDDQYAPDDQLFDQDDIEEDDQSDNQFDELSDSDSDSDNHRTKPPRRRGQDREDDRREQEEEQNTGKRKQGEEKRKAEERQERRREWERAEEAEDRRKEQEAEERQERWRERERERVEEAEDKRKEQEAKERQERRRERERAKEQEQQRVKEQEQQRVKEREQRAQERERERAQQREQDKKALSASGKDTQGHTQGTFTAELGHKSDRRNGNGGAGREGRGAEEGLSQSTGNHGGRRKGYNVLDLHRSSNRPTRPPTNQDLTRYRQKQQVEDSEEEDDNQDGKDDEEANRGQGRKTRTKNLTPTPTLEGFYPKAWGKVFALAKDKIYSYLLNDNLWPDPDRETLFNPKILTMLHSSIDYAEKKLGLDLSAQGNFYPEHQDAMVELLWAFVATFRSKCKGYARDTVKVFYEKKIWPSRDKYPNNKQYQAKVKSNVEALLHGSTFHKNGKDENGRTNNFMNPAMGALASKILWSGKRPLGGSEDFNQYSPKFAMALVTFLRSAFDELKSGKAGKASFYESDYGKVYRKALKMIDQLKRDEYHWQKTTKTWDDWRLDNKLRAGAVDEDEDGEQSGEDMDIDLD